MSLIVEKLLITNYKNRYSYDIITNKDKQHVFCCIIYLCSLYPWNHIVQVLTEGISDVVFKLLHSFTINLKDVKILEIFNTNTC